MDALLEPLTFQFFLRALLASVLAGTVCAVVGSYVVLKGLAFIGDAVAHAAFPGVVVAYIVGAPYALGGGIAAFATAITIGWISRRSSLRVDTAIGVVFAGAFALGIFLYSSINGYVGDLFGFLVGNVLAIGTDDLIGLLVLSAVVLGTVAVLWKELLYSTFDPLGAAASGLPVTSLDYLFLGLVAITIVISLQAVGIILVVAMLVTPAATAQLLTVRFSRMILIATLVGAITSIAGLYLSYWFDVASGATIVLVQTAVFLAALVGSQATANLRRRKATTSVAAVAIPD
ncbi:MAG TPA: metal ABC transporter permease [Candidatus Limnocylindrales bacterium]|jgi:ABC-type Mn2+/Zn2+ transport system permease subunit